MKANDGEKHPCFDIVQEVSNFIILWYTERVNKNATDLLQVINFTGCCKLSTIYNDLVNFINLQPVC